MRTSETIQAFAPAFLAAQKQMQTAVKDKRNPHFNSAYSDFASVVEAVKGALNASDIAFLQPVRLTDAGVEIETVLLHKSGEFYAETLVIPLAKRDAQAVGSAISYGKRYGLQSICGIPSEDDDGNAASGGGDQPAIRSRPANGKAAPPPAPAPQPAEPSDSEQFRIALAEVLEGRGFDRPALARVNAALCKRFKVTRLAEGLTEQQRMQVLEAAAQGKLDKYMQEQP